MKSATTTKLDDAGDYDSARAESDHTPPQLSHFRSTSVADVPLFQVVGLGLGSALSGSRHAAVETSGCLVHPQLSVNTCPNLPVITNRSDQALQEGRSDDAWLGLPGRLGLLGVQGCPARVSSDDDPSWRDAVVQRVEQSIRLKKQGWCALSVRTTIIEHLQRWWPILSTPLLSQRVASNRTLKDTLGRLLRPGFRSWVLGSGAWKAFLLVLVQPTMHYAVAAQSAEALLQITCCLRVVQA